MTQEQKELFFELTRHKLEAKLVVAEVKAKLRRKLMVKESEVRVAAAVATVSASAAASASATAASASAISTTEGAQARMSTVEEDDITDEVPLKVTSITLRFAGLPQEEIVRIFQNKFKPINFYHLCHMRRLQFDPLQNYDRIGIEDGMLRLRKTSGIYKDFGKFFYEVWADVFQNYTNIFDFLFSKKASDLHTTFLEFYSNIYELSLVYEWQNAVFLIAIEAYTYIVF